MPSAASTVCVAKAIHDLQINFDLEAGEHTLQGWNALQFLRSRHGVGDGSDTTRISNQQLFLSALMRKIKSEGTLTNPLTIYALAKAAASNMQLSTSLSSLDTMASMALAVKDIPLANIAFVTYPSGATSRERGRAASHPRKADAQVLMDAIAADAQIVVTGKPGGGAVAGRRRRRDAVTRPDGQRGADHRARRRPTVVELPSTITGQQATAADLHRGQTF